MPQTINSLSKAPELINEAIDKRQAALDKALSRAERELYFSVLSDLVENLTFGADGKVKRTAKNLLQISKVDAIFDRWGDEFGTGLVRDFTADLLAVGAMTADMYDGMADEAELKAVTDDNTLLLAALGITAAGAVITGSMMWEIWRASQVRQELKNRVLSAIKSGQTLKELTKTVRDFTVGTGEGGKITAFWHGNAYDLFNQAAEIKNEQFRAALKLHWFIYAGDIIKDSRAFCIAKAGKVFADVEADTEWPNDPNLIGKNSGVPYTPRIDRGRWNCRHRIRYITRELAVQLDKKKVEQIEAEYGSTRI